MSETERSGLQRRQVLKGAAWATPVIAAAATVPFAAAASNEPDCGCLQVGSLGAFTAQAVTALNYGTVTGAAVYNLDSSGCDTGFFKPAYTVVGLGGKLDFDDGTSHNFTLGGTTGAGTIGQISAFTTPFTVIDQVSMPTGAAILGEYKKNPTRITMHFQAIFVPIIPITDYEGCNYTLTYDITDPRATGGVVLGTGTVNWTDLTPSNPVLTGS